MSIPSSIADTALGLTTSELQIFRHQQQLAAQRSHQAETVSRGRGNSRSSQPSSRAASAASSQGGQGRLFLDPGSLQQLNAHFEHLMRRIQDRIDVVSSLPRFVQRSSTNRPALQLQDATQNSVQASYDRAGNMIQNADAEIARMRRIIAEIDAVEAEFDKIKHIRDVIKRLRARVDEAESRLDRSHTHGHSHSHSHSHGARDSRRR
jgi:hypothetical protein